MRKTGGILILCAAIFGVILNLALIFFLSQASPAAGVPFDVINVGLIALGNLAVSAVVVTLAIFLLTTRSKLPSILLLAVAALSVIFGWGGGITTIAMIVVIIGALLTLGNARDGVPRAPSSRP